MARHHSRAAKFSLIERRVQDAVVRVSCNFRAFLVACAVVVIWAVCGPKFDYSDTWQLVINTGTTIVTFLISFLIAGNQQRADRDRQVLLEKINAQQRQLSRVMAATEEQTDLVEQHVRQMQEHMRETAQTTREIHAMAREIHLRFTASS